MPNKIEPDTPSVFRLNIEVGDLAAATALYAALFNAPARLQAGSRAYFTCGAVTLQVVAPGSDPHPLPKALYLVVQDLEAIHARAASLGVLSRMQVHGAPGSDPVVRPWGERSFYVDDPWGNQFCFVEAGTLYRG